MEPCFGFGHNLSLICQLTSEDIKHQLIIIYTIVWQRHDTIVGQRHYTIVGQRHYTIVGQRNYTSTAEALHHSTEEALHYWALQTGLLTPLTFTGHRLSPFAAFTSCAYFLQNGRR